MPVKLNSGRFCLEIRIAEDTLKLNGIVKEMIVWFDVM